MVTDVEQIRRHFITEAITLLRKYRFCDRLTFESSFISGMTLFAKNCEYFNDPDLRFSFKNDCITFKVTFYEKYTEIPFGFWHSIPIDMVRAWR